VQNQNINCLLKVDPLVNLFAIAWNTGQLPTLMCRITLLPIFKKGDPLECSNYRGIANLSQWLKILSKIIYFRIDSYCEQIGVLRKLKMALELQEEGKI